LKQKKENRYTFYISESLWSCDTIGRVTARASDLGVGLLMAMTALHIL